MSFFLYGRFSAYAKFFVENTYDGEEEFRIFSDYATLYTFSSLYGYLNNTYAEYDPKMDDETQHELKTEIRDEYLTGKHEQARRLILLNEKISGRNDSEKIEATFRYDFKKESEKPKDNPERLKNDKIIEQYALGGLEKIYGKFSNVKTKEEAVKRIYGIIEEFALDCKIIEPKENIPAPEFDEDYA